VGPLTTRRYRALSVRQRRQARRSSAEVTGPTAAAGCGSSSQRLCATKVRNHARAVCVARWYDPATAEFTSIDPDAVETGTPYAYAGDDPVNEGDPSGMDPCVWADGSISGGGCSHEGVDMSQLDGRQEYSFIAFDSLHGWNAIMAAAVVGNFTYESGGLLDPSALEWGCSAPSPTCGIGIAQWSATDRRQALQAAGGWVPGVPYNSLEPRPIGRGLPWDSTLQGMFTSQVAFAISEFLGPYSYVVADMKAAAASAPQTSSEATAQLLQAVALVRDKYEVGDANPARYIDSARVFNRFGVLAGVPASIQADEQAGGPSDAATGCGARFTGPLP